MAAKDYEVAQLAARVDVHVIPGCRVHAIPQVVGGPDMMLDVAVRACQAWFRAVGRGVFIEARGIKTATPTVRTINRR
jgi:hypothetical protein